jgi:trans-aconitate 2-methyltransferase
MVEQSVSRGTGWQPGQYGRYRDERSLPFYDLAGMVQPDPGMRIVDLGCGTGELTKWLHEELQASETVGLDSSPVMLAESGKHTLPGMRYEQIDILEAAEKYRESFDLVFSNAALQWILGHDTLFPKIAGMVKPGGQLAVQIPHNGWHIGHQLPAIIAREEPFASALGGWTREDPVRDPEFYMDMLYTQLGFRPQRVRTEWYTFEMESPRGIVEWVKGSVLSSYREHLPADLYPKYVEAYEARLLQEMGDSGPFLYPFKRILFWGRKPA